MAEELQKELDSQFGWADSLFKDEDAAKQQQSSRGSSFETMTQDQASELSGRFTALSEVGLQILSHVQSIQSITIFVAEQNSILSEIKNLAISSNGYLEDISGFQKKIYDVLRVDIPEIKQKLNSSL